ncbi:MAG: DUF2059 domain-containing protein [Candidatus Phaeomarinobacter sp.]
MVTLTIFAAVVSIQVALADEQAEKLALAEEMIRLSQADQVTNGMIATLIPLQVAGIKRQNPELTADQMKIISEVMSEELNGVVESVLFIAAPLYADTFTKEELTDYVEFYKSASGRRMIEEMPALTQKGMQLGMQAMQARMPDAMERLKERLSKKGIEI